MKAMELVDLRTFRETLQKQLKDANWTDCALPDEFKSKFNSFGQYKIEEYYTYSAKVTSAKSMCIIPNQWFYIATCCSQYHSLLCAYKEKLQDLGITDEQFEACHPSADNRNFSDEERKLESCRQRAEEYLKDYKGKDKSMLVSFLWNYEEWGGGKNIKRSNDFTESPVLNLANLINASSGLVGALAKAIANSEQARETLMSSSNWKFVYEGGISVNLKTAVETPIANYITQHDDEDWSLEQLQEECQLMYDNGENKPLAMHIFGISFAPHIDSAPAITSKLKTIGKEEGDNNYHAEINKGKNIGLFLRKFIQKSACPTLTPEDLELMKQYIDIFTNALKTKPFLLLAGISGTGKSQKVKELAYASCPNDKELRSDETKPGNYCLIEVKPNWHDSTELLGYWSNLSQKYMLTDFIRFAYKATKHPNVPFFLCLDEMNLAPVEQYFAEYLSVLESRKVVAGKIVTEPLITKDIFKNCNLTKDGQYAYTAEDASIIEELQKDGLRLPDNLFVIGTVNMDDTTHQFSRKVIDRAFTIEMNGGKLEDMFSDENKMKLEYRPNGQEAKLELFKSNYTKATEAIDSEKVKPFAEVIKTEVPKLLNAVNDILEKTPFRVSYRVQNELVLYICNIIETTKESISDDNIKAVINTAFLAILLEKILPRVQGDRQLLKTDKGTVFTELIEYVGQIQNIDKTKEGETDFKSLVLAKLQEMDDKPFFTSFFG